MTAMNLPVPRANLGMLGLRPGLGSFYSALHSTPTATLQLLVGYLFKLEFSNGTCNKT